VHKFFFFYTIFIFSFINSTGILESKTKFFEGQGVEISILNKLTTKNYVLISPLSQEIDIGNRKLIIYKCIYRNKEKSYSQLALIKFFSNGYKNNNFIGWLFNDSPSLSELEDPVFDLRLNQCLDDDPIFPNLSEAK